MEKAVSRREILLKKGEAATTGKTNTLTQTQLDSILTGLRRKVKQYKKVYCRRSLSFKLLLKSF